jgi:hypothetical protein
MLNKTTDPLSNLKIASPCPIRWEEMKGDDRARFCDHCDLHVYNISELTRRQAVALIEKTEGRLCGRIYRRADGSILTRDCPVGLRAIRKRFARIAGATATAVLSFCFAVVGQKSSQEKESCSPALVIAVERKSANGINLGSPKLAGVIKDMNGAVVPGVSVEVSDRYPEKTFTVTTNDEGLFQIGWLEAGTYSIKIVAPGFADGVIKDVEIKPNEMVSLDVTLAVATEIEVTVGVLMEVPLTNSNSGNTTTFSPKQITKLPY